MLVGVARVPDGLDIGGDELPVRIGDAGAGYVVELHEEEMSGSGVGVPEHLEISLGISMCCSLGDIQRGVGKVTNIHTGIDSSSE
jgi:hypothetical protein